MRNDRVRWLTLFKMHTACIMYCISNWLKPFHNCFKQKWKLRNTCFMTSNIREWNQTKFLTIFYHNIMHENAYMYPSSGMHQIEIEIESTNCYVFHMLVRNAVNGYDGILPIFNKIEPKKPSTLNITFNGNNRDTWTHTDIFTMLNHFDVCVNVSISIFWSVFF